MRTGFECRNSKPKEPPQYKRRFSPFFLGKCPFLLLLIGNTCSLASNFIGGGAANCGGSAWNLDFGADNRVTAISYSGGSTGNIISSNTIANYTVRQNTANEIFKGIFVSGASSVTMNGNTIGSATGTANITGTATTVVTGSSIHGIYSTSTGTMDITNNNIRGITLTTASANTISASFYGIRTTAGTNTITGRHLITMMLY